MKKNEELLAFAIITPIQRLQHSNACSSGYSSVVGFYSWADTTKLSTQLILLTPIHKKANNFIEM